MAIQIRDILTSLNGFAPFNLAEEWDNIGLLVGSAAAHRKRIVAKLSDE